MPWIRTSSRKFGAVVFGLAITALTFLSNSCGKVKLPATTPEGSKLSPGWVVPVGTEAQGVTVAEGYGPVYVLPAPIQISGGWNDSPIISLDGQRLYFAYSRIDFFRLLTGEGFFPTGPARAGMVGNEFDIFTAKFSDGVWSEVRHPANSPDGKYPEAAIAINETEDAMVFVRWDPDSPTRDGNLFVSLKSAAGWSGAVALAPLNTTCEEDNPHIIGTTSGARIYFDSNRGNLVGTSCASGEKHLYTAEYNGTDWINLQQLPAPLNQSTQDWQIFVTPDKKEYYWTTTRSDGYGVYISEANETGGYTTPRLLIRPTPLTATSIIEKVIFVGEVSKVSLPEGDLLYFGCAIAKRRGASPGPYYGADDVRIELCVSKRSKL